MADILLQANVPEGGITLETDGREYQERLEAIKKLQELLNVPGYEDVLKAGDKDDEIILKNLPSQGIANIPDAYHYSHVFELLSGTRFLPNFSVEKNVPLVALSDKVASNYARIISGLAEQSFTGQYDTHEYINDNFTLTINPAWTCQNFEKYRPTFERKSPDRFCYESNMANGSSDYTRTRSRLTRPTFIKIDLNPQNAGINDPDEFWEGAEWSIQLDDSGRITGVYFDPIDAPFVVRTDMTYTSRTSNHSAPLPLDGQPKLLRYAFGAYGISYDGERRGFRHDTDIIDGKPKNNEWDPYILDVNFEVETKLFTPNTSRDAEVIFSWPDDKKGLGFGIAEGILRDAPYYRQAVAQRDKVVTVQELFETLARRYKEIRTTITNSAQNAPSSDQLFFLLHVEKNLARLVKGEEQQVYAE